ncbi:unnamed protein product [Closterium sp. NIES-64]|nr:unnamed protein product [Closterium sp. NIES-64]
MGCASSAPTANAAAGEVGNGGEGQAEEWTLCGCGGNRRAKEGKVRTQAGGEKRRRTRENEAQKGEALRDGRAIKNERNAEVMRGGDRVEERDERREAHDGRVGGKVRAEDGQNGAERCDGTGMNGGAGGGTLKVRSTEGAAGRGRVQAGRALAWQRGGRGGVGGRDARGRWAEHGGFRDARDDPHHPSPTARPPPPTIAGAHCPHGPPSSPNPRPACNPPPARVCVAWHVCGTHSRVGVLAFEVAAAVVRAGVVRQSVEGEDVDELRREVLASDGIAFLLSSDFNHVWQIAARDKWEEVGRLAASVARLGSQCTDTALHSLALRFSRSACHPGGTQHCSRCTGGRVAGNAQRAVVGGGGRAATVQQRAHDHGCYPHSTVTPVPPPELRREVLLLEAMRRDMDAACDSGAHAGDAGGDGGGGVVGERAAELRAQKERVRAMQESSFWDRPLHEVMLCRLARVVDHLIRLVSSTFGPLRECISCCIAAASDAASLSALPHCHHHYALPYPFSHPSIPSPHSPPRFFLHTLLHTRTLSHPRMPPTPMAAPDVPLLPVRGKGAQAEGGREGQAEGGRKLGESGMALAYARLIIAIDLLVGMQGAESRRDYLYSLLPHSLRCKLKGALLQSQHICMESTESIEEKLEGVLDWLVTMADNTIRYASDVRVRGGSALSRLQTLQHVEEARMERLVLLLLIGLQHLASRQQLPPPPAPAHAHTPAPSTASPHGVGEGGSGSGGGGPSGKYAMTGAGGGPWGAGRGAGRAGGGAAERRGRDAGEEGRETREGEGQEGEGGSSGKGESREAAGSGASALPATPGGGGGGRERGWASHTRVWHPIPCTAITAPFPPPAAHVAADLASDVAGMEGHSPSMPAAGPASEERAVGSVAAHAAVGPWGQEAARGDAGTAEAGSGLMAVEAGAAEGTREETGEGRAPSSEERVGSPGGMQDVPPIDLHAAALSCHPQWSPGSGSDPPSPAPLPWSGPLSERSSVGRASQASSPGGVAWSGGVRRTGSAEGSREGEGVEEWSDILAHLSSAARGAVGGVGGVGTGEGDGVGAVENAAIVGAEGVENVSVGSVSSGRREWRVPQSVPEEEEEGEDGESRGKEDQGEGEAQVGSTVHSGTGEVAPPAAEPAGLPPLVESDSCPSVPPVSHLPTEPLTPGSLMPPSPSAAMPPRSALLASAAPAAGGVDGAMPATVLATAVPSSVAAEGGPVARVRARAPRAGWKSKSQPLERLAARMKQRQQRAAGQLQESTGVAGRGGSPQLQLQGEGGGRGLAGQQSVSRTLSRLQQQQANSLTASSAGGAALGADSPLHARVLRRALTPNPGAAAGGSHSGGLERRVGRGLGSAWEGDIGVGVEGEEEEADIDRILDARPDMDISALSPMLMRSPSFGRQQYWMVSFLCRSVSSLHGHGGMGGQARAQAVREDPWWAWVQG